MKESNEPDRLHEAFYFAPEGMALLSLDGEFVEVNRRLCEIVQLDESVLLGLNVRDILSPNGAKAYQDKQECLLSHRIASFEMDFRIGDRRWAFLRASLMPPGHFPDQWVVVCIQDTTERMLRTAEYRAQAEAIRSLVDNSDDVFCQFGRDYRVLYVNHAVERLTQRRPDEVLGKRLGEIGLPLKFSQEFETKLEEVFLSGKVTYFRFHSEEEVYYEARFVPETRCVGEADCLAVVIKDISSFENSRRHLEEMQCQLAATNEELLANNAKLLELANLDVLTGAKSRRRFDERLLEEISLVQRKLSRGELANLSLLLFDLDHFKAVTDSFGHAAGDRVLRTTAEIVRNSLRPSDVLGRYGGEEFVALLPDTDEDGCRRVAERCRMALEEYSWPGARVTASFGAVTWNGGDAQTMLAKADFAMYAAKKAGRNKVRHFSDCGSAATSGTVTGADATG